MSAEANKAVVAEAFAGTSRGDGRSFVAMLDDDVRWEIIGTTSWSRTFVGKDAVIRDLLAPLAANFAGPNTVTAERIMAEGDLVVVEGRNHSRTLRGADYPNRYCWVMRLAAGKVREMTEYCDTALIERVLAPLGEVVMAASPQTNVGSP